MHGIHRIHHDHVCKWTGDLCPLHEFNACWCQLLQILWSATGEEGHAGLGFAWWKVSINASQWKLRSFYVPFCVEVRPATDDFTCLTCLLHFWCNGQQRNTQEDLVLASWWDCNRSNPLGPTPTQREDETQSQNIWNKRAPIFLWFWQFSQVFMDKIWPAMWFAIDCNIISLSSFVCEYIIGQVKDYPCHWDELSITIFISTAKVMLNMWNGHPCVSGPYWSLSHEIFMVE